MKNYQYYLFDWDGCLAQTLKVWLDSYKEVFAEYGLQPSESDITSKVFGDWNGPLKVGLPQNKLDGYTQKLLQLVNSRLVHVELYPHVLEVIQELHNRGKKLAILSTSKRESIEPALKRYDLERYFEVILTAENVTNHKPDPEIIDKALHLLAGHKDQAVIIGDSKSDLGAAQNATIDSILFYPASHTLFYELDKLKDYHPTHVISDFKELLDVLE